MTPLYLTSLLNVTLNTNQPSTKCYEYIPPSIPNSDLFAKDNCMCVSVFVCILYVSVFFC